MKEQIITVNMRRSTHPTHRPTGTHKRAIVYYILVAILTILILFNIVSLSVKLYYSNQLIDKQYEYISELETTIELQKQLISKQEKLIASRQVTKQLSDMQIPLSSLPQAKYILTAEEQRLLENLVWCEAGNQAEHTQMAITQVVINRLQSPYFPSTITKVINQPKQFSPAYGTRIQNAQPTDTTKSAVQRVLNGEIVIPNNVVYFWLPECVNISPWFESMQEDNFYQQIEDINFYYCQYQK